MLAQPQPSLAQIPLLTLGEQQQLVHAWNATGADYPQDQCIHEIFEAQAAHTPDAVALVFDRGQESGVRGQRDKETRRQGDKETRSQESGVRSQESEFLAPNPQSPIPNPQSPIPNPQSAALSPQSLTYSELNRRANQLARYLRKLGVGPDVSVGICLDRTFDLVIGLLG